MVNRNQRRGGNMSSQLKSKIENNLSLIKKELLDENSPMYLKNVRRMQVASNGMILLDPNNKEDRDWYNGN